MVANGIFDAPIPGQSLTQAPGATPIEHPPRFVHLDEALNYMWDKLHSKKGLTQMLGILNAGIPVEAIARTIIYQGLMQSLWTVDIAMLMFQTVVWQIEAIAKLKGINYKLMNEDKKYLQSLSGIQDLIKAKQERDDSISKAFPDTAASGAANFKGFF